MAVVISLFIDSDESLLDSEEPSVASEEDPGVATNPLFRTLVFWFVPPLVFEFGVAVTIEGVPPILEAVVTPIGLMFGNVALKTTPVLVGTGGDGGLVRMESD